MIINKPRKVNSISDLQYIATYNYMIIKHILYIVVR